MTERETVVFLSEMIARDVDIRTLIGKRAKVTTHAEGELVGTVESLADNLYLKIRFDDGRWTRSDDRVVLVSDAAVSS